MEQNIVIAYFYKKKKYIYISAVFDTLIRRCIVTEINFDDTSIDTAGPASILWQVCSSGPHLIWIQEHSLKCLTPMFNLAAEEHYWVAWYKET